MPSQVAARELADVARQIGVEKSQHGRIGVAPIVLADQAVLRARIDHHLEGLVQILKFAKKFGAMEK
jgi:hypothetical protein